MGLIDRLGTGPVALDTAVFIYFMEEHPSLGPVVDPVFEAIACGRLEAVTSAVTLLEVLVVPYREGHVKLAERYEALLTRSRGLRLLELSRPLLRNAAQLRAVTGAKTPDALQLAAALHAGCTALVTNDRVMPRLPGLDVLQVGDFVGR